MTFATPSTLPLRECLAAAGLTNDLIARVVLRGETERDSATAYDAPTRGGMCAYFERVFAVREALVPLGWTFDNSKNLCTTISPDGNDAIAIVTGDGFTGQADGDPQPRYARGAATAYAVNNAQLELDLDAPPEEPPPLPRLWFLLVYRPPGAEEVRVELSRPDAIAENGTVTCWTERNLLDPVDLTMNVDVEPHETVEEAVEVQVVRKR